MPQANLTERQRKWFESVRASLERDTGRSLAEWVLIARQCPESGHRARLKWLKDEHRLLQNRASQVLSEAFPSAMDWNDPASLIDSLWGDGANRSLFDAVDALAMALPDSVRTTRKGYTAWSRKVQFAAARPLKDGKLMLGIAISPDTAPGLEAPRSESWSERLKARIQIDGPQPDLAAIQDLLTAAWDRA